MSPAGETSGERRLSPAEIEPLKSVFLESGWRNQAYDLREVWVSSGAIRASVDIIDFVPSANDDDRFYLSTTIAAPVLAQLGIIYACAASSETKRFAVWSRAFQIENHRRVREAKGIDFTLTCTERFISAPSEDDARARGVRDNFQYRFDIGGGAFSGSLWLVFRRPPVAVRANDG